ncbi:MAG: N-acetylglucosamine-6-phosphate deacetylase [Thermomicrobiales bacterium]|nr:N-acetylglucosamine-6-phosphate deacetylase [Thermomicrobiales bacterium]
MERQGTRYAIRGKLARGGTLSAGAVVVEGARIAAVLDDPREGDLPPDIIDTAIAAPGYIDLQVNGAFGVEIDEHPEHFRLIAERLPETGVTSWLPTVISSPPEHYPRVLRAYATSTSWRGAEPLGFHLEGPFLSPQKAGAHPPDVIRGAPDSLISIFASSNEVRLVTLAPERTGGIDRIRLLREAGKLVSLGHTNATYEELRKGIDAGAAKATHLYSTMSGLHHRAPGAVGAILVDDRITAGMISDGVHAHPGAVELAYRMKGSDGMVLVTDQMSGAGMPPGNYPIGNRLVTCDGRSAQFENGTLAGSLLTMDVAVRNMVTWGVCGAGESIQMATETPAALLGITDRGQLQPGARADLVLLDSYLNVTETIVGGTRYWSSPPP